MSQESVDITYQELNAQTGKLEWPELQRHFARGVVIVVQPDLDLVGVAAAVVKDDRQAVQVWLESGGIAHATDEDARRWYQDDPIFWAVVAAPWVLVQVRD